MSEEVQLYGINKLRDTLVVAESTRKSMRGNKSKGTGPEMTLRRALWSMGLRGYRTNVRKLPGTPDIVFRRKQLVIFVHGCFWHGHTCLKNRVPTQNREFWAEKIRRNQERHTKTVTLLQDLGFKILTLWECELREDLQSCIVRTKELLEL